MEKLQNNEEKSWLQKCRKKGMGKDKVKDSSTQDTSIQLSPARGKSELQKSVASSLLQERIERGVA